MHKRIVLSLLMHRYAHDSLQFQFWHFQYFDPSGLNVSNNMAFRDEANPESFCDGAFYGISAAKFGADF